MNSELYVVLAIVLVLGAAYVFSKGRSKKSGPKAGGSDNKNEVN